MNRLKKSVEDLRAKGYKLEKLRKVRGGINSAVFKTESTDSNSYALKLYRLPERLDKRNRCLTEKRFIEYLRTCPVDNTPRLIESNVESGWSLLSWIEGEKTKSLRTSEMEQVADFISLINESANEYERSKLERASEACMSLKGLITSVAERINKIDERKIQNGPGQKAIIWLREEIKPELERVSKGLMDKSKDEKHWQDIELERIASPSDVGVHNTLRSDKQLSFLDFEYAGLDDLSKLVADWILQPEHCLNYKQERLLIERIQEKMAPKIGASWERRLEDIKPLIKIKWCLIMINKIHSSKLCEKQLEKAMRYYAKNKNYRDRCV